MQSILSLTKYSGLQLSLHFSSLDSLLLRPICLLRHLLTSDASKGLQLRASGRSDPEVTGVAMETAGAATARLGLCVLVTLLATGKVFFFGFFFLSVPLAGWESRQPVVHLQGRSIYGVRVSCEPPGSTGLVCNTVVESLDLGCLLRWDCPRASPNTTYTVQTKTQG